MKFGVFLEKGKSILLATDAHGYTLTGDKTLFPYGVQFREIFLFDFMQSRRYKLIKF